MNIPKTTLAFLWCSGSLLLASGLTQYPAEAPFRFISCVALSGTDLGSIFYPKAAGISPQACQQQCALSDSHFAALGSGVDCYCSHATTGHEMYPALAPGANDSFSLCNTPCQNFPDYACGGTYGTRKIYNIFGQHGYIQFLYGRYSIQLIFHQSFQFRNNYRSCLHNIICNVIYTTVFSFLDDIWNLHGDREQFDNNSFCVRDSRHFQLFKCFGFCSRHYQYTFFQFPEFCDHDDFTVDVNLYFDRSHLFIEPNQKHKHIYRVSYHISAIFNDEFLFHYISHQPDSTTFEFFRQLKRHLQPAFIRRAFIGNREFNCKLGCWHHFNTPIRPLQLIFWHFANSSVTFRVSAGILTRNARIVVFCPKFNRNI
ncbi:hypothetical protein CGCS363_v013860 [Colletotrichum siamense]|uniref:uncharacterized protein n=1 Tax=Colletotrichum siamense TaxID=690259 RepID=UPI00187289F2|nr:uncharacterized protein CGCS363_v013860 [Colletotrichum siamense]KAF5487210.1 hypothetical protein CGCS363_v013860 [Colletotrichum siamense]